MIKLFTYGTLKRGMYFHNEYMKNATYLADVVAGPDYSLYIEALPSLVKEVNTDSPVKGELYEVTEDMLKNIDDLEGHPNVYRRELIDVYMPDGAKTIAWAYLRPVYFKGKAFAMKSDEYL